MLASETVGLELNNPPPERPVPAESVAVEGTKLLATNAVVAICVVFVATAAVGAVGAPVNVGDAIGANAAKAGTKPEILVAKIPADALISASTIVPSAILAEVTDESASIPVAIVPISA